VSCQTAEGDAGFTADTAGVGPITGWVRSLQQDRAELAGHQAA